MEKLRVIAVNLIAHALGLLLLIGVNDFAHIAYMAWFGEFGSRGIAPGAAMNLSFLVFTITSLLISVVTPRKLKLFLAFIYVAVEAWLLIPYHPLRAVLYCSAGAIILLLAMYASLSVNGMISRKTTAIGEIPQLPGGLNQA